MGMVFCSDESKLKDRFRIMKDRDKVHVTRSGLHRILTFTFHQILYSEMMASLCGEIYYQAARHDIEIQVRIKPFCSC